jgi:uncharacterized protein YjiS (DUF1127 family)
MQRSIVMSTLADRLGASRRRRHGWRAEIGGLIGRLGDWRRRALGRAALARLSERELRDIGLTPAEALWEYAKPFWRG